MKILFVVVVIAVIAFLGAVIGYNLNQPTPPLSGVTVGNEYNSTVLRSTGAFSTLIDNGTGTLGSIVITTAGAGNVIFYDASSTIYWQRTTQATTSLPVLAVIDANQAAGNYVYDVNYTNGLLAVFSGTQGTTTVLYR